jgi:hypothetical protein
MYDPLKAQMVCELLESQEDDCQSLRQCCAKVGVAPSTFLRWCDENEDLAERYARADRIATEIQFERLNELNEVMPPMVDGRVDNGWVQWQRMRIDNRKWALSKRRPSKYGEKVAVGGDPGNPIQHKVDTSELIERIVGNRKPTESETA